MNTIGNVRPYDVIVAVNAVLSRRGPCDSVEHGIYSPSSRPVRQWHSAGRVATMLLLESLSRRSHSEIGLLLGVSGSRVTKALRELRDPRGAAQITRRAMAGELASAARARLRCAP